MSFNSTFENGVKKDRKTGGGGIYILYTATSRKLSEKMCQRQFRKVVWDMINTLFLTLYLSNLDLDLPKNRNQSGYLRGGSSEKREVDSLVILLEQCKRQQLANPKSAFVREVTYAPELRCVMC